MAAPLRMVPARATGQRVRPRETQHSGRQRPAQQARDRVRRPAPAGPTLCGRGVVERARPVAESEQGLHITERMPGAQRLCENKPLPEGQGPSEITGGFRFPCGGLDCLVTRLREALSLLR